MSAVVSGRRSPRSQEKLVSNTPFIMEFMEEGVMRMSVKELKDIIFKHGRSIEHMLDKGELRKLAAECLRLEVLPDDCEVTGERTVDERNAEGFANAKDLDAEEFLTHRTRGSGQPRSQKTTTARKSPEAQQISGGLSVTQSRRRSARIKKQARAQ